MVNMVSTASTRECGPRGPGSSPGVHTNKNAPWCNGSTIRLAESALVRIQAGHPKKGGLVVVAGGAANPMVAVRSRRRPHKKYLSLLI